MAGACIRVYTGTKVLYDGYCNNWYKIMLHCTVRRTVLVLEYTYTCTVQSTGTRTRTHRVGATGTVVVL